MRRVRLRRRRAFTRDDDENDKDVVVHHQRYHPKPNERKKDKNERIFWCAQQQHGSGFIYRKFITVG